MDIAELDFDLPESLIAQNPPEKRGDSRLLVVDRTTGTLTDCMFSDFPDFLKPTDTLVLNETRVVPARIRLQRKTGALIEGLFIREIQQGQWEVMLKGKGRIREGETLIFLPESSGYTMVLTKSLHEGYWHAQVPTNDSLTQVLETIGSTPLPPYIRRGKDSAMTPQEKRDRSRYQTIYARSAGSVAAPTAGLHFTDETLSRIIDTGIPVARVTLHVGPGTFAPIKTDSLTTHQMHSEWYSLDESTTALINQRRQAGGRTVAVGTTSVRTLESCAAPDGQVHPGSGWTDLFCYPPYSLKSVDVMLTNFHLPRSTLLALVMCAAGIELIRKAYAHAVQNQYRFFSYGDAMLIL